MSIWAETAPASWIAGMIPEALHRRHRTGLDVWVQMTL